MSRSLPTALQNLSLNTKSGKATMSQEDPIVDSWDQDTPEPEALKDAALRDSAYKTPPDTRPTTAHTPAAPPPTPASPHNTGRGAQLDFSSLNDFHSHADETQGDWSGSRSEKAGTDQRPEKTTATASRMIAAGLGMKPPKRTEDEKAYDRALREKERSRREDEKRKDREYKENEKKARAAIWDD